MRVIAGEFRSRLLKSVPGIETRPTPDRLREALFNILAPQIAGSVFLDAYAGSGSVGIEALSRGAARAIFIEESAQAAAVLEANLKLLGISGRATLLRGPVRRKLAERRADLVFDLVFLDPPYGSESEYASVLTSLGAKPDSPGYVIAQHSRRLELETVYGNLGRYRQVRQGENVLSFYRPTQIAPHRTAAEPELKQP